AVASFNANGNSINVNDNNNDFTTAQFNGGDVTLTDKNALLLGTSTATGNLKITTGGTLTQSGILTANGASKTASFFVSGANSDILLGAQANDIGSAIFDVIGAGTIHDLTYRSLNATPSISVVPSFSVFPTVGHDATFTFDNGSINLLTLV